MKKVIKILIVITILLLSGCASSNNGSSLKLTNPVKKCSFVNVPYETQESYIEKEPYQALEEYEVDMKYEVISREKSTTLHGFDVWAV